ncbi:DUF4910 domain-containing protein [Robertkochia solimangrovi]|uniref:DUF4910 domain-containing protein n=1 Tax=Robertkochia solimangrovi TaxID=2213046 RepID=UPI00117FFF0B|nr:DUF4910 domain-containing protein [Robertkochia solimangrovi]TRZ46342.1 hypothetical protein DMZ48_03550 [Robertkochia solimangrovi]
MTSTLKYLCLIVLCGLPAFTSAQKVPLNQEELVSYLDQELSGESAKRNLEYITRLHRMRGSDDYNKAIAFISEKLTEYNLEGVAVIKIPADGKLMYGTHKTRPAWNVKFAELWEQQNEGGVWTNKSKIADYESIPMVVAQDSKSGEVATELVDIGSGSSESDYENKNIEGKLVLTSSQPGSIADLAINKYKAAGIISYAQNQPSAWHGEDENLIRWGHFDYFADINSFAFMVSLKQARAFQNRLNKGEQIRLFAYVETETKPTDWDLLTAVIKGTDEGKEEILLTCHLDHPRPGANDNASGCAAILEVARSLKKLIDEERIERPKRTIRFLWSPEIEGTKILLNYDPEFAKRTKFNIHMDMVGGGLETKGVYQVSRGPMSLPSFINDIGESFGMFLNYSSLAYASGSKTEYPMVSKEGGKEPLQAIIGNFSMGSDFEVFTEASFQIPSIYLHQYPDRYIHTNYDAPGNIDPTILKRSAFIGAASAYYLADFNSKDVPALLEQMKQDLIRRSYEMLGFSSALNAEEQANCKYYFWEQELQAFNSIKPYAVIPSKIEKEYKTFLKDLMTTIGAGKPLQHIENTNLKIYSRKEGLKGGMLSFGYDYFKDHYGKNKPAPKIFSYHAIRGSGSEYGYEILNRVNGKNSVSDIRNMVSAEFGPIPMTLVSEYLEALESIGVVYVTKK